ncbi:MAG: 3-phosphoshikimate 1-carboxyvinyltransferase [Sumerlaeia bacterium]
MKAHVHPATKPLSGVIEPPSSKNYTLRYVIASAYAPGASVVHRPAVQDDSTALVRCLKQFGAAITALDRQGRAVDFTVANAGVVDRLEIIGFGAAPKTPAGVVDPDNAGAVLRMLIGVAALCEGEVRFDTAHHKESLGKRPNRDLLDALEQLGVETESRGEEGALPLAIRGGRPRIKAHIAARRKELGLDEFEPFPVTVSGAVSSQFLSALLFMAPNLDETVRISVTGSLRSVPLIETTRSVMRDAGIEVESDADRLIHQIRRSRSAYAARRWDVNGDWPGSAAILAAAAVVPGSDIAIRRLKDDEQGERRCIEFYRAMGCHVAYEPVEGESGLALRLRAPEGHIQSARINGDLCTDAVLAMMSAGACAEGVSRFLGIGNLQFKECDRVREPIAELRKIDSTGPPSGIPPAGWDWESAASVAEWEPNDNPDVIQMMGRPEGFEGGIEVDGRGDHRVIMMLSVVALRCRLGLTVTGAHHVAKSFPGWFETLGAMGAKIDLIEDL